MSEFRKQHLACPCGKSSDAYAVYHSGVGHCFSCGESFPPDEADPGEPAASSKEAMALIRDVDFVPLKKRGLTQDTCRRYGYGLVDWHGQRLQAAPFHDDKGRLVAQKIRTPNKDFPTTGKIKDAGLFGQQLVRAGGKMLVVTEGEIDAMSVYQAMGSSWPAVSLKSGAGGAVKDIKANLEFLEGQDKIVLCFDQDEPGRGAVENVVDLFSPGKVAVADLGGFKDANEMLQARQAEELRNAIWSAKAYRPDGVVDMSEVRDRVEKKLSMGIGYPWQGLNDMLYGFRPQELITWTAGTGIGKSAIVSEIVYDLIKKDVPTGIIYLEEGIDRAGKRIVGLEMNKAIHLPNIEYTPEEFDRAWEATLGKGNLFAYDHFGSLDGQVLMSRIRYMVKSLGCQVVVLDHISMVVSGADLDSDERRMLDHIMTGLRSLTQETGATLHVVSHLRRPPGSGTHEEGRAVSLSHLRGTQAIGQLSDAVIAAERDQQAEDAVKRNTTTLRVLKNRYAGLTGEACELIYDHETGRLADVNNGFEASDADY